MEKVAHRIPVIAGTGSNDCAYAIELSRHACAAGADALLYMSRPTTTRPRSAVWCAILKKIADACDKPVILYNVPRARNGHFAGNVPRAGQASEHRRDQGSEREPQLHHRTARLLRDELYVYSGNDDQTIPLMAVGASGLISVLSNVMPAEVSHDAPFSGGRLKGSAAEQLRLIEIMNAMFMTVNPIPVKTAMAMLGACSPEMPPLAE